MNSTVLAAAISEELTPNNTEIRLPTEYQSFIHLSRYARYNEELGRRETWQETIKRYFDFFDNHLSENFPSGLALYRRNRKELETAVLNLEVMPSMRCLMTAGKALERDHVAGYNCSFLAVDSPRAFDETMYILMCFAPETLVKTKSGDKKISELTANDEVLSFNTIANQYEYIRPSNIVETPSAGREKIELEFEDGYVVRCTADHKFLTQRGWVEAKDLTEEDEIQNYHE